jgi:hypothetical protein
MCFSICIYIMLLLTDCILYVAALNSRNDIFNGKPVCAKRWPSFRYMLPLFFFFLRN